MAPWINPAMILLIQQHPFAILRNLCILSFVSRVINQRRVRAAVSSVNVGYSCGEQLGAVTSNQRVWDVMTVLLFLSHAFFQTEERLSPMVKLP